MKLRSIGSILALTLIACTSKSSPEVPAGAHSTPDGVRWISVRPGCGLNGADGAFWSVEWTYVPEDDFGQHVYNGPIATPLYDPFRSNLTTMKEGERRRVWVPNGEQDDFVVADLHLR